MGAISLKGYSYGIIIFVVLKIHCNSVQKLAIGMFFLSRDVSIQLLF